jgi:hypothetical protein
MALQTFASDRPSAQAIYRSLDVATPASTAFARICDVESWPVWLSFLIASRRMDPEHPLELGSEIGIRSQIPGDDEEELFEVDRFIPGHQVSLVGAYSCRRRLDLRIEQKSDRSRIVVRLDYPTYGGALASLLDRLTLRRRLDTALADSLAHFKGLVEFDKDAGILADF